MKYNFSEKGNILLWAIIAIGGPLIGVVFATDFIIMSLQQGQLSNDALKAYYLAEAGAEQSLYQLRHVNEFSDINLAIALDSGRLVRSENSENQIIIPRLNENQVYQLDLTLSPAAPVDNQIDRLQISGQTTSGFLEIQAVGWTVGNVYSQMPLLVDLQGPTAIQNGFSESLAGSAEYYRRVRFKALHGDITNLNIAARDSSNNSVNLPARVIVSSQGFFQRSSQKITVTMPRQAPLYGLFDYVIFSEELINK